MMDLSIFAKLSLLWCICMTGCTSAEGPTIIQSSAVYKVINGDSLTIDIFQSKNVDENPSKSAIVFYHGGGWAFGDRSEFYAACHRYAEMGFVTFSVQYRLCIKDEKTPHPTVTPVESVKDARSAMRWVRGNSERFNLDPEKIVVAGQSVGGQLALSTAMIHNVNELTDDMDVSPVPNAIISFSGTVNTVQEWSDHLFGDRREEIWSISPAHHIQDVDTLPPVVHFHGTADHTVPLWTIKFFEHDLKQKSLQYDLREYPGRKHYLGEGNEKYANYFDEEILLEVDRFLRKTYFLSDEYSNESE